MSFADKLLNYFGLERSSISEKKLEAERIFRKGIEKILRENEEELVRIRRWLEIEKEERRECDELSEILLKERDDARKCVGELSRLSNLQNPPSLEISRSSLSKKIIERFFSLPNRESELLVSYIPRKISEREPTEKIRYQQIHAELKGFPKFLDKLSRVDYIHEIHTGGQTRRNAKRTIFYDFYKENKIFIIKGLYISNGFGKEIFVHTIARNEMEAGYIRDFLNCVFE